MASQVRWKPELKLIDFDIDHYRRIMFNTLRFYNERAGWVWLDTTLNQTPIPTYSGGTRATFIKLANDLGFNVSIGPLRTKSRVSQGQTASTGGVIENRKTAFIGFYYTTSLAYVHWNEYNRSIPGPYPQPWSDRVRFTPYSFQSRAANAWKKYVKDTVVLPSPMRYIKGRPI